METCIYYCKLLKFMKNIMDLSKCDKWQESETFLFTIYNSNINEGEASNHAKVNVSRVPMFYCSTV